MEYPDYYNSDTTPTPPMPPVREEKAATSPSQPTVPGTNKTLITISNFLSGVFLPLLIPTYIYTMVLWITPLSAISERVRLLSSLIIFLITTVPPLATILFLMRRGKVQDVSISNPKERTVPYVITVVCYFIAGAYVMKLPMFVPMFFVGAAIAAAIAFVINFRWKISAHATSMGGMCAVLLYVGFEHYIVVTILPWICGAILCSGLVGSARMYLGRHTAAQVFCGWLLGAVITFTAMII